MVKVDPARAKALVSQLQGVNERIAAVAKGRHVSYFCINPPPHAQAHTRI